MSAGSNYLNEMNFHWCSLSYLHNSWVRLSYFCSYEFTNFIFPWKRCSNTSIPRTTKPKQIKPWVNRWSNCVAPGEGLLVVPHLVLRTSSSEMWQVLALQLFSLEPNNPSSCRWSAFIQGFAYFFSLWKKYICVTVLQRLVGHRILQNQEIQCISPPLGSLNSIYQKGPEDRQ